MSVNWFSDEEKNKIWIFENDDRDCLCLPLNMFDELRTQQDKSRKELASEMWIYHKNVEVRDEA